MRILVCILMLAATTFGQFEKDPRYVKKRAERYMAQLNFDKAIQYLKNSRELNKEDGEIPILLGECYFAKKMWRDATKAFRDGLKKDPSLVGRVSHLPLSLIRENKLDEARQEALILSEKGHNARAKANGFFCLGLVAWHQGAIKDAIKHYERSQIDDPMMPKSCYRLGLAYLKTKQLEKGIEQLEKAIKLDRLHQAAAHNLALAYRRTKSKEKAKVWRARHKEIIGVNAEISQISRSLAEKPGQIQLVRRLADIYYKYHRFQDAIAPYSACVAAAPKVAEPRFLYASCFFEIGDYHNARLQLNQIIDRHKDFKPAQTLHARIMKIMNVETEDKK